MLAVTMTSRWGVQLEGELFDLDNLAAKVQATIVAPSSFFVTRINEVYVLRTSRWDDYAGADEVSQIAADDIACLRGCLDILDTSGAFELGTIYEFTPDGRFSMTRTTQLHIRKLPNPAELGSPLEFKTMMRVLEANTHLRQAFADLPANPGWVDIYRSWESLKTHFGGEHKLLKRFAGEGAKIKRPTFTANSYRHVIGYAKPADPMPLDEAKAFLQDLLKRSVGMTPPPATAPGGFVAGTQVSAPAYLLEPGQPAALNKLSLSSSSIDHDARLGSVVGRVTGPTR